MKYRYYAVFLLILLVSAPRLSGLGMTGIPDSLRIRQLLYNGREWKNEFRRYNGDQFLFANYFLPGEISCNGRTFVNVKLKYDIYSDQVLIPRSLDQIIQLNKEMIDSFKLVFENRVYTFARLDNNLPEGFVNILYSGRSILCVKYIKRISTVISDHTDGSFYQVYEVYCMADGTVYRIEKKKDIFNILGVYREQVRKIIKENKIRVSRKAPESYIPVIRFYDSVRK